MVAPDMPALDRRITVRRLRDDAKSVRRVRRGCDRLSAMGDARRREPNRQRNSGRIAHKLAARAYVIRYRAELADAPTSELSVIDGTLTLDATNITEATRLGERRKYLRIECIGEVI